MTCWWLVYVIFESRRNNFVTFSTLPRRRVKMRWPLWPADIDISRIIDTGVKIIH